MQTHYTPRIGVILALTIAFLWAIFPNPVKLFDSKLPFSEKTNLKPGIDIKGGAKLIYQIKPAPGTVVESNLAERVLEILKKRVDPQGVRNLVWRPLGATMIEIQMPAAAQADLGKDAKLAYANARRTLERLNIREAEVMGIVRSPAERAKLADLAAGSAKRTELFKKLVTAVDAMDAARAAKDDRAAGQASAEVESLLAQLPDTNIDIGMLEQFLDKPQTAPVRLKEIRDRLGDFPQAKAALDQFTKVYADYHAVKSQLDDVSELKRLLRGSGVLEFRILVTDELSSPEADRLRERLQKRGPNPQAGDTMRWCRVAPEMAEEELARRREGHGGSFRFESYNDDYWILAYSAPNVGTGQPPRAMDKRAAAPWNLTSVSAGRDQSGGRSVNFGFDAQGAVYFGELSGNNIGKPLGIVLDNTMISAPNLRSIITNSGQITGNFTESDVNYLVRTLTAGSLPAQLADEPLREEQVGPQLGQDNLRRGLWSCVIALVAVALFMAIYYHFSGLVAVVALLMNMIIILGVMSLLHATWTLPAIAGIVLTIGMSVDANVLIFERLREEQQRGLPLRMVLRNSYDRAFSAILDSNMVTAITCIVLYLVGSEEVKGFGLTLLIGIGSSMFTALFVTKTIFGVMVERGSLKSLGSLPQAWPAFGRLLHPNVDWIGKAKYFIALSVILLIAGFVSVIVQFNRGTMLDVEFTSGTSLQIDLKAPMSQAEMRRIIESDPKHLPSPSVVAVERQGGTKDSTYEIITPNSNGREVKDAVLTLLAGKLKIQERTDFAFRGQPFTDVSGSSPQAIVLPVTADTKYDAGFTPKSARANMGGVAIVLKKISPPLPAEEIRGRLDALRLEPGSPFADLASRSLVVDAPGLPGDPTDTAVAFLSDPNVAADVSPDQWRNVLAEPFWKLTNEAIYASPRMERISQFDASVASDMQRDAILALVLANVIIMIYVWLRFGDFKYGTATIVAMMHDAFLVVGFVGLSHVIAKVPGLNTLLGIDQGFRVNLTLVAAVLTVMGYSMVDTIVVFDRIRENRGKFGKLSLSSINDSINQTLSRTMLTAGTTFVAVFIMYLFGGSGIHGFTFVMVIGILVGTYSSIAIASPILLMGTRGELTDQRPAGRVQRVGN